jgi:uncharacterized protein
MMFGKGVHRYIKAIEADDAPPKPYNRPMSSGMRPVNPAKPCAVCGKPQDERFPPFCSRRCADVDLHRWLSGAYVLPAGEDDDNESVDVGPQERA